MRAEPTAQRDLFWRQHVLTDNIAWDTHTGKGRKRGERRDGREGGEREREIERGQGAELAEGGSWVPSKTPDCIVMRVLAHL
jgi:hypothetical protein